MGSEFAVHTLSTILGEQLLGMVTSTPSTMSVSIVSIG